MPRSETSNNAGDARFGLLPLVVGVIETNCYLLWDAASRAALIIDPGAEPDRILEAVARLRLAPETIVNTHGHADHIGANGPVRQATGARLLIHASDQAMLTDPAANLSSGFGSRVISPAADGMLTAGQSLAVGRLRLRVLGTPGHTPGSVCLLGEGLLFSGDTLFANSVGRTDLPGGNSGLLGESLHRELLHLPPETRVYPGHGPATVLKREIEANPFLRKGYFS